MLVVAHQPPGNVKVGQQLPCLPGILCGYNIRFLQNADSPEGHVLQIADGRRHQIKGPASCAVLGITALYVHSDTLSLFSTRRLSAEP
ncbi:hypothetical protein D3C76_1490630 [compost metagenome]